MHVQLKSKDEILLMRDTNQVVCAILDVLQDHIAPGISTWDLNEIAAHEIERHHVKSAFLGYYDYPAVLCTSINHIVVHGIPKKDEILNEGDIIGIDFGVFKEGYCGDSARTVPVGTISEDKVRLIQTTQEALDLAIEHCIIGNRLGDIGFAVQNHAEKQGYSVVRQFVGHGIGRQMHEDPPVPNYGRKNTGMRLKEGLVIAIEPMVNAGTHEVVVCDDGWTVMTKDLSLSAHVEHSIAVTQDGPWVLSQA